MSYDIDNKGNSIFFEELQPPLEDWEDICPNCQAIVNIDDIQICAGCGIGGCNMCLKYDDKSGEYFCCDDLSSKLEDSECYKEYYAN